MAVLFRLGAYFISTVALWQFFQGDVSFSLLPAHKALALDTEHGMVFGVCAGISNYTGLDVSIIRFLWFLSAWYKGLGIGLYLLAFLIMLVRG